MTRAVAIQAVSFFFIGGSPYFSMMEMVCYVFRQSTYADVPSGGYGVSPLRQGGSVGAFAVDDDAEGLDEVHDVDPDGPVAHVPGVHGDALGECGVAAAAGLPHAGDAGLGEGDGAQVAADLVFFARQVGTRAYEAHVAFEDVQYLRQFVEAGPAEKGADAGDAWVVAFDFLVDVPFAFFVGMGGEVGLQLFVAVLVHTAEFVAFEGLAVEADAVGVVERGAAAVEFDGDGDSEEERRDEEAARDGECEVEDAFVDAVAPPGEVVAQAEHEDLLGEEGLGVDAHERCADEVGDEEDVAHVGLDALDEALECFLFHAGGGDDDGLDACVPEDARCFGDAAVEAVFLREAPRDGGVVDDAADAVAAAEVACVEAEDALGGLARADEDDGLVEGVEAFHDAEGCVALAVDEEEGEEEECGEEEVRGAAARGHEEEDADGGEGAEDECVACGAHDVDEGAHLPVGVGAEEEELVDAGDPDVEVGVPEREGARVEQEAALHAERGVLREEDGRVVECEEEERIEVVSAVRKAWVGSFHVSCSSFSLSFSERMGRCPGAAAGARGRLQLPYLMYLDVILYQMICFGNWPKGGILRILSNG